MKKRVINIIRNIFDGVMIFVLFITTTVYALPSNGVIYDNSNSGSSATNVSEAIDDLYSKLTTKDNEINRLKGLGNVASNQMLKGYTALVKGSVVTGSIPSKGATTYTPGTTNQTIASGNYLSGVQTIKGDANLVAGNIAKGKSIFGVAGSYTSDANAVAGNILSGKTAYVNGAKITGNMPLRGGSSAASLVSTGANGLYMTFPYGYYPAETHFSQTNSSEVYISNAKVATALGITTNKIAKGQSVSGVAGSFTSDANATAADIAVGKTAYVNGNKITGIGGGAKVYTFSNVPVTMPSGVTLKYGSWVSLNSDKDSAYNYSIDLGFTPTEVIACELEMKGDYFSSSDSYDGHNFRFSRGYASGTANAQYYYFHTLIASLKAPWLDTADAYGNDSGFKMRCVQSGSKLNFNISKDYYGSGGGTNLNTRAGQLKLSGTLVYK